MARSDSTNNADRMLRVDLDVTPNETFDCPMTEIEEDLTDVRINAAGEECNVDIQPADTEKALVRKRGSVEEDCLCFVFQDSGCVPRIRSIEDGTLLVTAYVDDRETIRKLIAELDPIAEQVRLVRLTVVDGPDATEHVTFDLSSLTAKQREAIELAVIKGYFDSDCETELRDLASELDISKPAVSQRLRIAQSKLVQEVFEMG
jgi:predicted DNA binding protein